MKELAYYDGEIGTPDEVKVPFNDRVHFFGDGVYDATVGGNHKVYLLKDHLDRFYSSAAALDIKIPMEKAALGKLLTELLEQVEGQTHFVYWQVTRGAAARNHVYSEDMKGKLWVMIRPNKLKDPEQPIRLITREDKAGADETVFHRGEIVTECAHSNVSILKDGVFISHPNDNLILRGISKTHMIQACYELGIQVMERPFTLEELRQADEIIVTSSSNFCLHAESVDGVKAGGKDPVTLKRIQDAVIGEYLEYTGKDSIFD